MTVEGLAFYHDPPLWVGSSPIDEEARELRDLDALREVVYQATLPCAIDIRVTREGLFAFSFNSWELQTGTSAAKTDADGYDEEIRSILSKTVFMNAFLALLYANLWRYPRMMVTPELTIAIHDIENPGKLIGFGSRWVEHLWLSSDPSSYSQNSRLMEDARIIDRLCTVSLADLHTITDKLAKVMASYPNDGLLLLDLFQRASKAYQDYSYSSSLISNWAITEKLIGELWIRYQADNESRDGEPFITAERRKRLKDGRTYTAAVIAETLSLTSYIDYRLYTDICHVRKARNDWMHALKSTIYRSEANLAISVCERMFMGVRNWKLNGTVDIVL